MSTLAEQLRELEALIHDAVAERADMQVSAIDYDIKGRDEDTSLIEIKVTVKLRHSPRKITGRRAMDISNAVFETICSERDDVYPVVFTNYASKQEVAAF